MSIVNIGWFVFGLAALIAGAELLVRGASRLALSFGISPLVVGLTIVAFGTSSPEVAVSVGAALQGQTDIAIGNVVGSNTFNILGCLGLSSLVTPAGLPAVAGGAQLRCLGDAGACVPAGVFHRARDRVLGGGVFLGYYAAYTAYVSLAAQAHDALPAFSRIMLLFVLPLTVITLLVLLLRTRRAR